MACSNITFVARSTAYNSLTLEPGGQSKNVTYAPSGENWTFVGGVAILQKSPLEEYLFSLMSFVRAPPVLTGPITLSGELPLLITFVGSPDGMCAQEERCAFDEADFSACLRCHACRCAGFNVHDWVTENELELARAVQDYGAVLARGFPIPDASAFSSFVTGFTAWKDLPYEDSLSFAVRLPVTDRVCTTNEGKTG